MRPLIGVTLTAFSCIILAPGILHAQQTCEALKNLPLDHVTITSATSVAAAPVSYTHLTLPTNREV